MVVQSNRLDRIYKKYQEEYESKALSVLRSNWYILGEELKAFENEFADYLGCKYCAGVANGLDALTIAVKMLGIGSNDEVIIQGNTYIAGALAITENDAIPVFVEPDEYYSIDASKIEAHITKKTKAIMVVHMYGQSADMEQIMVIARKYNLKVIEDCAQCHGAKYQGKMLGTYGDIGCFSFYPTKNLGCFGDGGAIVTNNKQIWENIRIYRNYGSEKRYHNKMIGINSRLDEMQAGLLRVKLKYLNDINQERGRLCNRYLQEIHNCKILLPKIREHSEPVWHLFVIRTKERDKLMKYLEDKEIHTLIHYPIPPHKSEAYKFQNVDAKELIFTEELAEQVLTLPMYNGMLDEEIEYVINALNEY